jgi:hypothetical protein
MVLEQVAQMEFSFEHITITGKEDAAGIEKVRVDSLMFVEYCLEMVNCFKGHGCFDAKSASSSASSVCGDYGKLLDVITEEIIKKKNKIPGIFDSVKEGLYSWVTINENNISAIKRLHLALGSCKDCLDRACRVYYSQLALAKKNDSTFMSYQEWEIKKTLVNLDDKKQKLKSRVDDLSEQFDWIQRFNPPSAAYQTVANKIKSFDEAISEFNKSILAIESSFKSTRQKESINKFFRDLIKTQCIATGVIEVSAMLDRATGFAEDIEQGLSKYQYSEPQTAAAAEQDNTGSALGDVVQGIRIDPADSVVPGILVALPVDSSSFFAGSNSLPVATLVGDANSAGDVNLVSSNNR